MKRIFDTILLIACTAAAACGGTACTREDEADVGSAGTDGGRIVVRADVEGRLATRSTMVDSGTWCLSTYLDEHGTQTIAPDFLIGDFSSGYGKFKWHEKTNIDTEVPYELYWDKILKDGEYEICITLDNAPVYWGTMADPDGQEYWPFKYEYDKPLWDGRGFCYSVNFGWNPGDSFQTGNMPLQQWSYVMPFFNEEEAKECCPSRYEQIFKGEDGKYDRERYSAHLEPEEGGTAPNDLLSGHWIRNEGSVRNKIVYIEIPVKHIMSRVHVEISAPNIANLASTPVKVWIDNLASECYGIIRRWNAEMVHAWGNNINPQTAIIYPITYIEWGNLYVLQKDAEIYTHELYLSGSGEGDGDLLLATDGEGADSKGWLRTRNLVMPPQSTNLYNPDITPRLHIEIGGKHYSGVLPRQITDKNGLQTEFTKFGENQDITLRVSISDEPDRIEFSAQVSDWVDKGTWALDSNRGGIYEAEDVEKAIKLFNEFAATDEKAPEYGQRRHAVERYGHFPGDGDKFTFLFFTDIEGSYSGDKIKSEYKDRFDVELNGHTVYECDGKQDTTDKLNEVKQRLKDLLTEQGNG